MFLLKLGDNEMGFNNEKKEKNWKKGREKRKKNYIHLLPYRKHFSPQYFLDVNVNSLTLRDLDVTNFIKAVGLVLKFR